MNERHISGTVRTYSATGTALQHAAVSGSLRVAGKTIKELVFGSLDTFPNPGSEGILYVDTVNTGIYYWSPDDGYVLLTTEIDDLDVDGDKTWSSSKINDTFQDQQAQIDQVGNFTAMTNAEILVIFGS